MNIYFIRKSNGNAAYITATTEGKAKENALKNDRPGVTVTYLVRIRKNV